ncbi:MAG: DNA-formamidopyrimidine glycosylase family protein [Propionicimonas sp.]
MPEGHVIHRLARGLEQAFEGRPVRVSSPQGRFAEAAALLDGRPLLAAEAYGKHLFVEIGDASLVHIHLGLIGKLRLTGPLPVASPATLRLRIETAEAVAELRGPQTCELITPGERDAVVAGLGPDPLRADADPERGFVRVSRSERAIASLLLDQRVAAGVGNIFRCEALFRQRLHPMTPGRAITRQRWRRIWDDLLELMPQAVAAGRIDTVRYQHTPEATGRPPRVDAHGGEVYVYRRPGLPCLVCGQRVSARAFEGRNLYWCNRCQRQR